MKKQVILLAFSLVWLALPCCTSCTQPEEKEDNKPVDTWVAPTPGEYTFVCPEGRAWVAGDKISIRGNYAPAAQIITLAEGDLIEEGKKAVVNLSGDVFDFPARPDGLYAAYPAEKVSFGESTLTGETIQFTNPDFEILAAYLNGNVFEFVPCTCALSLSIDGDYDSFYMAAIGKEDLVYNKCDVTCSSVEVGVLRPTRGNQYEIEKTFEGGNILLRFPGILNMKNGFVFYFGKGGKYSKMYKYTDAARIVRGATLDLGNITADLQDFDGKIIRAPKLGKPSKYDVDVEELSGLCLTEEEDSLWAVGDEGQLAKVSFEGKVRKVKHFSTDLEGVTRNPKTGDLLVSIENSQRVAKIGAPDFSKRTNLFNVQEAIDGNYGNSGLEGITYYKDDVIYVGAQAGAKLWKYTLEGELLETLSLKDLSSCIKEVADLCYDPLNDWLWMVDSETHKIFGFTGDVSQILWKIELPTRENEESVCVDHTHGCVWVGDDSDSQPAIYRYEILE